MRDMNNTQRRVGIVTTNFAVNYGARLQEFALMTAIHELGYDCAVLNYKPIAGLHGRGITYSFESLQSSVNSILKIVNHSYRSALRRREARFEEFDDLYIKLDPKVPVGLAELREAAERCDVLICGSDQIWNRNIFSDEVFYLPFGKAGEIQKVAYAPSIAEILSEHQYKEIAERVRGFKALSVREEEAACKLSNYVGREVKTVVDPVFLLSEDHWRSMMTPVDVPQKYILSYEIASDKRYGAILKALQARTRLPIVNINSRPYNKYNSEYVFTDLGPRQFIWLLANAEHVCTSSFHATAFGLIFKRKMTVVANSRRSTRHETIMRRYRMHHRLITEDIAPEAAVADADVGFEERDSDMTNLIDEAYLFLRDALAG